MSNAEPGGEISDDDQKIIDEISENENWTSSWYAINNFLLDYYITISMFAFILALRGNFMEFATMIAASVLCDLYNKNSRAPMRRTPRAIVEFVIFKKYSKRACHSKSHKYNLMVISGYFGLILLYFLALGNIVASLLVFSLGLAAFVVELYSSRLEKRILTAHAFDYPQRSFWAKREIKKRLNIIANGPYPPGHWMGRNKFASLCSLILIYLMYIVALQLFDPSNGRREIDLERHFWGLFSCFLMPLFLGIIACMSSLNVRARDVAKAYLRESGDKRNVQ